ncbi:hypothetical protein, partial [Clostridium sp.]|uniref:hypothetical protein n=1 Tax=Clostridium sp. TaxID=1506 RepID=UPI001A4D5C91
AFIYRCSHHQRLSTVYNGEVVFKVYVIKENGLAYRQLTYPTKSLNGKELNKNRWLNQVKMVGKYTILWSNGMKKNSLIMITLNGPIHKTNELI